MIVGFAIAFSSPSLCGNTVKRVVSAPTGDVRAVEFDRGCGATTGFSTQVSILRDGEALNQDDGGNVLTSDHGPEPLPRPPEWLGPRTLKITVPEGVRVSTRRTEAAACG